MIDHHDIIVIGVAIAGAMGGGLAWLWRHSIMIAQQGVAIKSLTRSVDELRESHSGAWREVRAALTRIEDKLDRKADR